MKRILYLGILLATLCGSVAAQNPQGQTRIAKEERTRYVEDSLLAVRLGVSIEKLRDSLRLMATKTYVIENYVTNTDSRLTDSRAPKGNAGGDLTGTYPNPTIKESVALTGSPTAPNPATATNSTQIATTAYVKSNLANYVPTTDSRLSDSRTPTGTAGGDLAGTYPNPTIKSSVALTGSPTAPTPATTTNSTRIATTAYVKSNLANYVPTSDSRLTDSRTPSGSAGGDLTGTYPNPTIKSSVTLNGDPTITGNLRLKGSGNYGNKLNFGDGDFVHLYEAEDDELTIKAKRIHLSPTVFVDAPTPATTDNSTKVATTAYVKNSLTNYYSTENKPTPKDLGAPSVVGAGIVTLGGSMTWTVGSGTIYHSAGSNVYTIYQNGTLQGCALVTPNNENIYAKVSKSNSSGYVYISLFKKDTDEAIEGSFYYMFISWK